MLSISLPSPNSTNRQCVWQFPLTVIAASVILNLCSVS